MKTGYYVFFGDGDYHPSLLKTNEWISLWKLNEWKSFIDELLSLEINTLMIYFNGNKLPYKSEIYPELNDTLHPNYQKEFLKDLLVYTKSKGLELIAVISTTGHAGRFSELNKDSMIEVSSFNTSIEQTLVSFPEHLRKNKLSRKEGAAQIGYGVLCHNKESSRKYAINIISEIIYLYGSYFDAIALHPPESAYPCNCQECETKFYSQTNKSLTSSVEMGRQFFIKSYLEFQKEILFPIIKKSLPTCKQMTFTIPWLFERSFNVIAPFISKETVIIEWDYNLDLKRIESLKSRLNEYMSLGHKVWFMPTAGFSFSNEQSIDEQIHLVQKQLKIAEDAGTEGIVHFLGPRRSKFLVETSMKSLAVSNLEVQDYRSKL
ncbi:MAG: hypothetical protein H0U75_12380 [Legionella sp.]|nr:hypothetical protein [Legionella sp.]